MRSGLYCALLGLACLLVGCPPSAQDQAASTGNTTGQALTPNDLVSITNPRDGATVIGEMQIYGVYAERVGDDIWVIVWPEKADGLGWPQFNSVETGLPALKKSGQWYVYCYFGGAPQNYKVVVYSASPRASTFLRKWYLGDRENGAPSFRGIPAAELPNGLVSHHTIWVKKEERSHDFLVD